MTERDAFAERGRALENEYFRRRDRGFPPRGLCAEYLNAGAVQVGGR